MVPSDFSNFFLASTGAGAALVGLLFVAVSVAPERFFGHDAAPERRAIASSAFSALVNAFFVSLAALIPGMNAGGAATAMGLFGLINTGQQMRRLWDRHIGVLHLTRRMLPLLASVVIYGGEIANGISLIQHGVRVEPLYSLSVLLLVIYGVGLTQAWQLLGAPRGGVLSWIFDPLQNVREDEEQAQAQGRAKPDVDGRSPQGATAGAQPRRDTGQPGT